MFLRIRARMRTIVRVAAKSNSLFFLRNKKRGSAHSSQGASWGVCGSGVPPYDFLNLYGVSDSRFSVSFF